MRSGKGILLLGENELTLSTLRFTLMNSRPTPTSALYRVGTDKTAQDALRAISEREYYLILVQQPFASLGELVAQARAMGANIPTLILTDKQPSPGYVWPESVLYRPSNARILETVAVMVQRKRGPKPGTPRSARYGIGQVATA
jgi:hypothetical protein